MTRRRRAGAWWPDESRTSGQSITELFADETGQHYGIHDRYGCVMWWGQFAMFLALPNVGSTSYDLLYRAAPDEFLEVHRRVLRALKQKRAAPVRPRRPRSSDERADDKRACAAWVQEGLRMPIVDGAFRRVTGGEVGCFGMCLREIRGTSESQILRALELSVDEARALVATRRPLTVPLIDAEP